MVCHGHEDWHPNVDFYYQPGGGPLLDMGPYYLTALTTILGPIRRVTGFTAMGFKERETQLPGGLTRTINVNTPTHIVAGLEFHSGVIAALVTSFDVWASELPRIEVYGAEGTLSLPDPDVFSGPVRIIRARQAQWSEMPLVHGYAEESRGIGIADMAYGIRLGRPHRASGDLALHVLEVMLGIQASALTGDHVAMTTTCQLPEPLPTGSGEHRLVH
jgi:predicted dehydrogenase